ncbi:histone-lysine N-methyltransferase ATXR3 isoform X2 [Prosopis cineraria]|uniref:histone-lysine N-methyltransferase ATXR3 isoform X2 n=1 Tax=Prosopis cineraria TaxID=364024 RepID=UPI00240F22F0|nr:histone-lysine N-methyltransferase ATXR3 isoform X2 [Prosopis cineraria]
MGDGGVACMPLQQQHIMERLPNAEKTLCGGTNGNGFNSKLLKFADSDRKKKMKAKKEEPAKKFQVERSELVSDGGDKSNDELENDETYVEKVQKEEMEEGELGTMKWSRNDLENGEFVPEKPRRGEMENGEIVTGKCKKGELEKGEIVYGKWRREDVEKGEIVPERSRRGEGDKGECGLGKGIIDDIEKGEIIPDRWHRGEVGKDDYAYGRMRRYQSGREKGWKSERERTPPSGRYTGGDYIRKKEFNRNGSQHAKSAPRWESGQERNVRISSMIVDEEKNEHSNGRNHAREYSVSSRLKRHGNDSDSSERKHYGDYAGLKSRRLSDESCRPLHSEHHSHRSVERSFRNSSSKISADKYSRNHESSLPTRTTHDRHGRSPGHSERSPRDRSRYYDHRDRTPVRRDRSPHGRDKSPYIREKSPHGRDRSPYIREKSPHGREKSPYEKIWDRSRYNDHKIRSPTHAESPQDRRRHHDRRDQTPNLGEQPPLDRPRLNSIRENNSKMISSEKHHSPHSCKDHEDKHMHRESDCSGTDSHGEKNLPDVNGSIERDNSEKPGKEKQSCSPTVSCKESPCIELLPEELPSMEEDMDICDTPPHVPVVSDSSLGKWFYLDYSGVEHGPSKLSDIKVLVNEGILMSDHFVKHLDSDRWLTAENAASPLATHGFPSIVSDCITQLVSPPEAPGNLLADTGDILLSGPETFQQMPAPLLRPICPDDIVVLSETLEEFRIDERVGVLLEGYDVIPGRELEAIKEALQMNFEYANWEGLGDYEGFPWHDNFPREECDSRTDFASRDPDSQSSVLFDKDNGVAFGDWFSGRWSCKGGDWKRNDDVQDRSSRKKLVLNDGFSLCEMPKSGCEDPRWPQKDDLYYPSQSRRLDLPLWAFCAEERADCSTASRTAQTKSFLARGVKGNVLPVVRINACVVNDQGSLVSEPRQKIRVKDRHHSRSTRPFSSSSDSKRSSIEEDSQSKAISDQISCLNTEIVNTSKDRLCTVHDLQLHWGDWYYLDGSGRERGPSSFSELQALVDEGIIKKHSSVYRKWDKLWVPVTSAAETSDASLKCHQESSSTAGKCSGLPLLQTQVVSFNEPCTNISLLDRLHPQFIGYTRGKLHELVMKSYKSREFAAAINEALDPWINARQPKKENEKQLYWKSEGDARAAKRARILVDSTEEDSDMEDGLTVLRNESTFDDLCGDAAFHEDESGTADFEVGRWSLLDGHVLARVFHYLRSDFKSHVFASLTCKHWRAAVMFYKEVSREVNLTSLSHSCTDSILWSIMNGYEKDKIKSMILIGCTSISAEMLEKILLSFPFLSAIDIRGCSQFNELTSKFPNVKWIKGRSSRISKTAEEPHKTKSLKQIAELTASVSKTSNLGAMDDFGELKDYFDSVDKRDTAKQLFRRNLYKRSKLYDARRSSSILSRDARTRRWAIKKSENGYKRMEEFIVSSLREIMEENPCDFFVTKVAEIEAKMKTGYYSGRGLSSVKEDISRMCRDAIKAKNHGDAGDMNHIVTLFIQLATRLEGSSKSLNDRDASLKLGENDSPSLFSSTSSKYRKNKLVSERKYKSNGARSSLDNGGYVSDREIRRRLLKLNRKSFDSEGETSDDLDISSEDSKSDNETTTSDSESDQEIHSESRIAESRGDGHFMPDEGLDFITDDREWGARMTKASLVPPVTRKYEVIDHYVTVADEEDVQRKMRVSLPDDYAEKLNAQKNGTEESDMELPEVKDYKPRKQLGDEVIEQEVYGIDPYTHNLLLDSMPEELDWTLQEKHVFIEDMLLRTLNKQVRHFTGTGSTPMSYPLLPVIDEIKRLAEEDCDARMVQMCQGILKAIDSRLDDKYVAYRKGLGVVCNKEEGFGEDDFVVEFLGEVYPVWKWFEKQDGIRSLQKNSKDPAPEFYNIYLERPKGDADGYDLVVVDAMHKANYASRICHSCRPNCEAKVTAVDGHYQIGIYTVRKIQHGEEITFDYNSVTESKEEYEASVCLCGSQVCRGSYLNLTGEGAFQKVLKEWHGILDRHYLMLEACELNSVSEEDYNDLGRAGLGSCLLGGLPDWLVAYAARLVRFINIERTKLPEEILRHNLEEKRKYFSDICLEVERSDAEVQAEGVYNQRLQNLAVTLDKVRYVMRCIFGDPRKAPPPLEKLSPEAAVSLLWKGEESFVEELLQCLTPHVEEDTLNDLKLKIHSHDPSGSGDIQKELQKSLLWLRDEVRNLPCTYKSRHDAAADLIHIYAYTNCFFRVRDYQAITSPPVYISPLDLGPKYADKLGTGFQEYRKTYGENYCLGQLIFWYNQSNANPDSNLARARRGCLSLPDVGSFYAKAQKPSRHRVYGPRTVRSMLARMEKQPQRPWPKEKIWSFKTSPKFFGSPMLDSVINNTPLDWEMVHWLKHRRAVFHAMWDR